MSLKKEGTHNHDLKINSRRQSILVLGSTHCWWSHPFEWALATVHLEAVEVWQSSALVCRGLGPAYRWQPPSATIMIRLGQDLELAVPPLWAFPSMARLLLSFCPFGFFRIVQSIAAISQGDTSMGLPSNTGPSYSRCLVAMRLIQTNERWQRASSLS